MNRIRPITRLLAFILLVLTLYAQTRSFVLPKTNSLVFQEQQVCTAALIACDSFVQMYEGDFKPPKHSFIDYSTFFSSKQLVPDYNPNVFLLLAYEPFQEQPEVFLEISVPPDCSA